MQHRFTLGMVAATGLIFSATGVMPAPIGDPVGACCFIDDGSCTEVTEAECLAAGGVYVGDDVQCFPDLCPPPAGACCLPEGICVLITEEECNLNEGTYQGNAIPCDPDPCSGLPCPGDSNGDDVVDVQDLQDLLDLLASWGPCDAPCPPTCAVDTNDDCNVDVQDLLALLGAWGPCP